MGFRIKENDREVFAEIINEGMKKLFNRVEVLPIEIDLWLNKQGIRFVKLEGLCGLESKYYSLSDEAMEDRNKRGW